MDRRLVGQIYQDVQTVCPSAVSLLVRSMIDADPGAIGKAADQVGDGGRLTAEAFAREELACAAAAAGDRDRANAAWTWR